MTRAHEKFCPRRSAILLFAAACVAACGSEVDDPNTVEGEWALEVRWNDSVENRADRITEGVIVLDGALPRYPDEVDDRATREVVPGRGYIQFPTPHARDSGTRLFETGPGADRLEVLHAVLTPPDSLTIELAPLINDFDHVLRGRVTEDVIQGEVVAPGRRTGPSVRGTFLMRRRKPSTYSDSAVIRSRRGTAEWD